MPQNALRGTGGRHPGRRRRSPAPRVLLATLAGLVLLAWPLAGRADAHATLIGTTPADDELVERVPGEVELRFDEPVELVGEGGGGGGSGVQVIDPEGDRADRGTVDTSDGGTTLTVPIDGDRRGTYTVAWRVVSEDGHNLSGSFVFHVGQRTGAATLDDGSDTLTDAVGGIGRWAAFAGALVLVGTALLTALSPSSTWTTPRPTRLAGGADGSGGEAGTGDLSAAVARPSVPETTDPDTPVATDDGAGWGRAWGRVRVVMLGAAVFGAVGMAGVLVAQTADASGRSLGGAIGVTPDVVLDTRNGVLGVVRLAALVVAALVLALPVTARSRAFAGSGPAARPGPVPTPTAGRRQGRGPRPVWIAWAAGLAAGVSLVCASLAGHAWTASNRAVAVPSDMLHVLAVGAWLGGLVGLAAILRFAPDRSTLVHRFSTLSLVAVVVIAVTGTISGVVQVRTLDGLTSTGYGQLLLAKVAGFAVMVLLGFYNREVLIPHLERMVHRLARSVRAEIGVAAAVLAVTAVLVNQPPARDQDEQAAGPVSTTVSADDGAGRLEAVVDPAQVGPNDVHLYFSGGSGSGSQTDGTGTEPVVAAVEVTAATGDVPPRRLEVTPVTPSHVSALDASLTTPGTWTFQVTAVIDGQPTTFTFEVPLR